MALSYNQCKIYHANKRNHFFYADTENHDIAPAIADKQNIHECDKAIQLATYHIGPIEKTSYKFVLSPCEQNNNKTTRQQVYSKTI